MKKKLFKFLIAASVITVFASVASLAASITIEENSEVINTETREVSINFTTSDIADTDQITALVYISDDSGPADTNIVYIDQNTKSEYGETFSFKMKGDIKDGTQCTLLMGGTGVEQAAEYDFIYGNIPTTVTINETTNGIVEFSTTDKSSVTVQKNTKVYLNIIPAIGYYIESVKENGTEKAGSIDVYRGGTYTYVASEDAVFTVTFSPITNVTDKITEDTGMTGMDALTLPEVFRGKVNNEATEDVAVAFGQIAPNTEKEIVSYGIYLTYENGTDVTTANPKIGPKFAHTSERSSDNQFGIIFEQLTQGSYFAQTYIEYTDGIVKGIKVPFTVAE
ncbi:MAG: hypothetical protein IJY55_04985 [Clostridia bacterium]|nr:hypothetical protein [Clostridia bacterium]